MDYQDTLDELNTTLNDNDNVTFTPEQKARALKKAWNDSFVVETVYDTTTTWANATWSYAVPIAMTTVKDILMPRSTLDAPEGVTSDAYEVSGGSIHFNPMAQRIFTVGDRLTIKGNKKLSWENDTLDTPALQEYVIALAGYNTLTLLSFQKANLFIKNDTSMSELIALRRELFNEVREYRSRLEKSYESA
jgi:hypothetical protein